MSKMRKISQLRPLNKKSDRVIIFFRQLRFDSDRQIFHKLLRTLSAIKSSQTLDFTLVHDDNRSRNAKNRRESLRLMQGCRQNLASVGFVA